MRVQQILSQHSLPEKAVRLQQYSDWLLHLGEGKLPSCVPGIPGIIEIPDEMVCMTQHQLEEKMFDNFLLNYLNPQYLQTHAIMSSTNHIIQQCNFEMVERLLGEMIVIHSIDRCVEEEDVTTNDAEVLNKINASGIAPHRLALKPGACIILKKKFQHKTRSLKQYKIHHQRVNTETDKS